MAKESRFIVVKAGEPKKFLRHEGHKQYWSQSPGDAMEYTKLEVAQGLADLHKGTVEPR